MKAYLLKLIEEQNPENGQWFGRYERQDLIKSNEKKGNLFWKEDIKKKQAM